MDIKKFTGFIILVIAACLKLQAQHSEGNPFARLGYKADVHTFGEKEEFHDLEEIVEIGEVLFNTKTNKVVGFVEDADSLIELKPELQSMSIDPLCEKYYSISPYVYCMNNPVRFIDPTGLAPIYDPNGNLIGTDDGGLQGKAIIMDKDNFVQGMTHEDAMNFSLGVQGLKNKNAKEKFFNSYNGLKDRPDYDGYLTKEEADTWWKEKSGEPLYVDQSKIDLPGINTLLFNNEEGVSIYKNFIWGLSNTGKVYGTLKMTLVNTTTGIVHIGGEKYLDKYDFDMDGRPLRDFATWYGRPGGKNDGKSFYIYGYKQAKIPVKKKK